MHTWAPVDVPVLEGSGPPLRLHDTATGRVRPTAPGPTATMYVCGITPYDATHLGHAAPPHSADGDDDRDEHGHQRGHQPPPPHVYQGYRARSGDRREPGVTLGGCWRTPPVASGGQVVSSQGGRRRRYRGWLYRRRRPTPRGRRLGVAQ